MSEPMSDVVALDQALIEIARACKSDTIVRDPDVLEAYAGDASEVTPQLPGAVVRVQSTAEVAAVLRAASKFKVPVTPRAGGTGRVGGAVPSPGGIVISVEKMTSIHDIDGGESTATLQPGVITGALHRAAEEEGLFYPPDPNSWETCALGGNIAANAAGPRAFKYGPTRDYLLGMTAVTGDGNVLEVGRHTKKGVTGYDLTALLCGSEGTLAVITEARVRLIPNPQSVVTLLAFLPDVVSVAAAVEALLRHRITPRCIELLDDIALGIVRPQAGLQVPEAARSMLLIELDGDEAIIDRDMERCGQVLLDSGALDVMVAQKAGERQRLWAARRQLSHTMRQQARFKLSEDVVVPRKHMSDLLGACRRISERFGIVMPTYGHAGDGNLHVNFLWDDPSQVPAVKKAIEALFVATVDLKGTLSGEHGIGLLKAPYLGLEQSKEMIALQKRIKATFDPAGILNPGKIFGTTHAPFHGTC